MIFVSPGSTIALLAAASLTLAAPVLAQNRAEEIRAEVAARGLSAAVVYDGDTFANLGGGRRLGATYLENLQLQLFIDGERLIGWPGATLALTGLWIDGGRPSQLTGDAQGVSNIEAAPEVQLYEAWLQQNLFGNHLSLLAGLYDLNSEFYTLHSAALFLNSSFGIGPELAQTGLEGPSIFPRTGFGSRVAFKPARWAILRFGILDGAPWERPDGSRAVFQSGDGLLLVSELAFFGRPTREEQPTNRRLRIGRVANLRPYDTKVAFGIWDYTADFNDLNSEIPGAMPLRQSASSGAYALADQLLLDVRGTRLSAFVEVGESEARVTRFRAYTGGGLVASGMIPSRPWDELGLGVAAAFNGAAYIDSQRLRGATVGRAETALELTFLVQLASWIAVQPDIQYVIAPGTSDLNNALAAQLSFEITI